MPAPVGPRTLLALALAAWTAIPAAAVADEAADYARMRLATVQGLLDAARPGYVLVLGDSNAQRAPSEAVDCGAGVVNAGIGGVRAGQYLSMIGGLRLRDGGAAAIVNVGTGDAWRGLDPMAPASIAAYEASVERIVTLVRPHVSRVVVSALPPLSGRPVRKLDPQAVEAYSTRLGAMCARIGCTYADPWAGMRGGAFGIASPGVASDGLHPDDPGAAYASLGRSHCGPPRAAARLR